jgi:hypothetical protein
MPSAVGDAAQRKESSGELGRNTVALARWSSCYGGSATRLVRTAEETAAHDVAFIAAARARFGHAAPVDGSDPQKVCARHAA